MGKNIYLFTAQDLIFPKSALEFFLLNPIKSTKQDTAGTQKGHGKTPVMGCHGVSWDVSSMICLK